MTICPCTLVHHPRRIVLTGGPGAGKTAVLELIRRSLCGHVRVLPESAGIIFGGGFPRMTSLEGRRAAQRAIFHVQCELEATAEPPEVAIALCDRGTLDSMAYWPGPDDMMAAVGSTVEQQLARYHAVIHLRVPPAWQYTQDNPLRIENAAEARAIDERIAAVWANHPRVYDVPAHENFLAKATHAIAIVRGELPACCRQHAMQFATA